MKRRLLLWIAPAIVIVLSTCTTLLKPPAGPLDAGPLPAASPLDPSKACANWRWIGIKLDPGADCPEIAGWPNKRHLFDEKGSSGQSQTYSYKTSKPPDPKVLEELNRFCVYEAPEGVASTQLPRPESPELVRIDKDCAAVAPSAGSSLKKDTWKLLAAHFLSQVGRLETLPTSGKPGVRLAILDTQPKAIDFREGPGNSPHGYTLAHIARNLVCGPGREGLCAARITTRLALPLVSFDPLVLRPDDHNTTRGGYFGTQQDLARAIKEEVDDWQIEDPALHLVLNLSVAWDGKLLGGLRERRVWEMPAGAQAVYRALEYAAGHGALVLAAAGNRQYGPYPSPYPRSGPLLPAAWEGRREEESCGTADKPPLLYAVGGVQSEGWPLANARLGGMPRRAAYADHAVVDPLDPLQPTEVYTGSSVATTVASSIAAAVWEAHPYLDAQEVMKILDASGDELPFRADFGAGVDAPNAPKARRLSLCSALKAACDSLTGSGDCAAKFRCDWKRERPVLSAVLDPSIATQLERSMTSPTGTSLPCRSSRFFRYGGSPNPPLCPSDRFFGITSQPWILTQPGDPPCPSCLMTPPPPPPNADLSADAPASYTLRGVIRSNWRDEYCLDGATLDIEQLDPSGSATRRLSVDFDQSYCSPGQAFAHEINIPSDVELDERTTATLGFVVRRIGERNGRISTQSPVLIAW